MKWYERFKGEFYRHSEKPVFRSKKDHWESKKDGPGRVQGLVQIPDAVKGLPEGWLAEMYEDGSVLMLPPPKPKKLENACVRVVFGNRSTSIASVKYEERTFTGIYMTDIIADIVNFERGLDEEG